MFLFRALADEAADRTGGRTERISEETLRGELRRGIERARQSSYVF